MHRTARASVISALALALVLPTAGGASAWGGHSTTPTSQSAQAKAEDATRPATAKPATAKPATAKPTSGETKGSAKPGKATRKVAFVAGGTVTGVDAAAGTVTFTVKGGKDKALRGKDLTVTVAENARVRRDGAVATVADLQVGDRVNVRGSKSEAGHVANRVSAEAAETTSDDTGTSGAGTGA